MHFKNMFKVSLKYTSLLILDGLKTSKWTQNILKTYKSKLFFNYFHKFTNPGSQNIPKSIFNFMAPFYGWGSTASRLEPLWGGSLLFRVQKYI